MRTRTWCVVLAFVFPAAPAIAQTVLSEADALSRLSPDSPRVRSIRASIDLARADVLAASRWPNPRVTFNRESVAGIVENIVSITQPLPITGRRDLEVSATTALIEASERRADEEIKRARWELRIAYADLAAAQVREAELTRARDRLAALAELLARREAAGDAAGYDRLRAEREVMDVEADRAGARADRARAQGALASFFADPGDVATIVVAVPPSTLRAPVPPLPALLERAETVRGQLGALQQEIEAAKLAERAAGRRAVPEPEVTAGVKSSNVGAGDIGPVFSVHATLPLFDRAQPEQAMARARLSEAEARLAIFRSSLAARIGGLRGLVAERREAADRYRAASTTSADELERIAQASYDAGERGILELLDAYRSTIASRVRQTALDAQVRQAELELEFVSGWEMP